MNTNPTFEKGRIVSINGRVGVVVLLGEELAGQSEDHSGVWFGDTMAGVPEIWVIPTEYLQIGPEPSFKH